MPTIRFWAGARAVAGAAEQEVPEGSLSAILESVAERYGEQMSALLRRSVLVLDGERVEWPHDPSTDVRLTRDSVLEILPPYAGG